MEQKVKDLISNLTSKTSNKETKWERVSKTDQFLLKLTSGKISINKIVSKDGILGYQFYISNEDGDSIITVNGMQNATSPRIETDYSILKKLHDNIKRVYFKVDETLDELLNESKKEGEIGTNSKDILF